MVRDRVTVVADRDYLDGGWVAHVAELPGCVGQGDTAAEAVASAAAAYAVVSELPPRALRAVEVSHAEPPPDTSWAQTEDIRGECGVGQIAQSVVFALVAAAAWLVVAGSLMSTSGRVADVVMAVGAFPMAYAILAGVAAAGTFAFDWLRARL